MPYGSWVRYLGPVASAWVSRVNRVDRVNRANRAWRALCAYGSWVRYLGPEGGVYSTLLPTKHMK